MQGDAPPGLRETRGEREEPVAEPFRLPTPRLLAWVAEHSHPGGDIGREGHEQTPDAVLLEPVQGQIPQARIFRDADTVLAARPLAVPELEIGELPSCRVRDERCQPVAVNVLEAELRARMRAFPADDDAHTRRPLLQVHEPGELGNVRAVSDVAVGVVSGRPDLFGDLFVELWRLEREREPNRVGESASGEPGEELVRAAAPVGADQNSLPGPGRAAWELRECLLDDVDVIGRGVRPRVPWAEFDRERLPGAGGPVVRERAERVETEPLS